ncbi:ubiquitin carboxyl-terminal hydrolase 37-like [Engraulis encrasicolus]|uniref:ubiquitin carboxyl-terminal hydrolase 37-like n=1 Tax=Engraulis encrasicolus TaxID=184585 RepID=UPI002FCE82C3
MALLQNMQDVGQDLGTISPYRCPVASKVSFSVSYERTCQSCGTGTYKLEPRIMLSLDLINQGSTMQQCLQAYFSESAVEFNCECCEGKKSTMKWSFHTLPKILIVHVNRVGTDLFVEWILERGPFEQNVGPFV